MLGAVVSGFLLSVAAPLVHRISRKHSGLLMSVLPATLFLYFASRVDTIVAGEIIVSSHAWAPALGVNLSFRLDGLSLLFALLITGIGALVVLYTHSYLANHPQLGRFYAYLLAFMASMLGIVLSDNVISLFVFWELTSLTSYLLIGFEHQREAARKAAWQALLVTGIGGLALLFGFLLLWQMSGSFELSALLEQGELVRSHWLYVPALLLILGGALTKSAQFPFHFWLPNAMEAPTPVSTYLHSATMVKAGIYLLARLSPVMGGTRLWQAIIIAAGAATMLLGGLLAVKEFDLKRILAYSTVSILGALTFLLGIGTRAAVVAAITYLAAHALYKAALFLVAGAIDHESGTRDVRRLGGLAAAMPITTVAVVLAALSMAGFPPLFGFIGKEFLYSATIEAPLAASVLTAIALLTSVLMVAVAGIVSLGPFFGPRPELPKRPHEAPVAMWAGPLLLAVLGLMLGLVPDSFADGIVSAAVTSVAGEGTPYHLALFHGLTLQLGLSGVTLVVGAMVFLTRGAVRGMIARLDYGAKWGPDRGYEKTLGGLTLVARAQTIILQSGHLHIYLLIIILTTVAIVGRSLLGHLDLVGPHDWHDLRLFEALIAVVIIGATAAVVHVQSRFAAVVALGVVGYGMGLIYIIYGAPDLAITQFSIDTLTVVLLVLVLYPMPRFARYSGMPERVRDGLGALAGGALMTVLALMATSASRGSRLSSYFAENSYPAAHGRNVVNVILVDFRALDTMGEITVLAVAAIGVYSLLKLCLDQKDGG
ncbi:MAG: putative monovalent cation/H+ antiporter subunit A [Candidatus Abyssubacteria bacterium]